MDVKQLELEIKEEVLNEMIEELPLIYIKEDALAELFEQNKNDVKGFDFEVYGEVERLIGGRVTRESIANKFRKVYERELNSRVSVLEEVEDFEMYYKATILNKWLNDIK